MKNVLLACAMFATYGVSYAGPLSFSDNSTITTGPVRLDCHGANIPPVATVKLNVNGVDQGLPGLIYVGAANPEQTDAQFFSNAWQEMGSGLFPIYAVVRSGLQSVDISFPLNASFVGWSVYVGYGALSLADEQKVEVRRRGFDHAKIRNPQMTAHQIPDDNLRATLIQMDMTKNTKYRFVYTPTFQDMHMCDLTY